MESQKGKNVSGPKRDFEGILVGEGGGEMGGSSNVALSG